MCSSWSVFQPIYKYVLTDYYTPLNIQRVTLQLHTEINKNASDPEQQAIGRICFLLLFANLFNRLHNMALS